MDSETKRYKVLVVDDDAISVEVITASLRRDYDLFVALNAENALKRLRKCDIDIVLIGADLPNRSGYNLCKSIKSDVEQYGDLCILFLTITESIEDEAYGLSIGANDYLRKPINTAILRARLRLQAQLLHKTMLLEQLARIDGLTEIPNRRAFDDHLVKEWYRAKREQVPISLVMIDIDCFKNYNDHYGHPAGDKCLKTLALNLTQSMQRSSDFVSRYGGEEFAIVLYNTGEEDSKKLMDSALANFERMDIEHEYSSASNHLTFSAGACTAMPFKQDLQGFVSAADCALYQAKKAGRARFEHIEFNEWLKTNSNL